MKMSKFFAIAALAAAALSVSACSRVGNGEVGVRYHTWGADRGVEDKELGMGYYMTGPGTSMEVFQTFTNTKVWSAEEGGRFSFSDKDGQTISADMAITLNIEADKTPVLFKKYRRGYDEIIDTVVHNFVRDSLNTEASHHPIEWLYGEGRSIILTQVQADVQKQIGKYGINIEKLAWIGAMEVPKNVKESINQKTIAKQNAQRVENEVAQTQAEAQKAVAKAQGEAQAITLKAEAQAKANQILASSVTPTLVEYMKVNRWNGQTPRVTGSGGSIISLTDK